LTKRSFTNTNDEILYLKNKIKELEDKLAHLEPKLIKNPIQHNNLESGRIIHHLAYDSTLQKYSGFYDFRTLNNNNITINKKKN
jgi:hypothetical protein